MKILDKAGIDYSTMGREEYCCGYLAYLTGSNQFKESVNKNLERFPKFKPKRIITTCTGCYKTFKDLYPKYSDCNIEILHMVEYIDWMRTKMSCQYSSVSL
jgi:Fe-S oxidoreductase